MKIYSKVNKEVLTEDEMLAEINRLIAHNGGEWVMGCYREAKIGEIIWFTPKLRFVVMRPATREDAIADSQFIGRKYVRHCPYHYWVRTD